MKKKRIKLNKHKYILKIKKIILFDDTEFFETQKDENVPILTEEEIDNIINNI